MKQGRFPVWAGLAALLVLALCPGCAYFQNRGNDAIQMMDLGITWSEDPYGALYLCGVSVTSFGFSHVEGWFAGMGGDQIGVTRHYEKCVGLVAWSYEEIGWGDDFDVTKPETLDCMQHVAPLGYLCYPERKPSYGPA